MNHKNSVLGIMMLLTMVGVQADTQKTAPRPKQTVSSKAGRAAIAMAILHAFWNCTPEIYATLETATKIKSGNWRYFQNMPQKDIEELSNHWTASRDQYSKDHPAHKKCPFGLFYRLFYPDKKQDATEQTKKSFILYGSPYIDSPRASQYISQNNLKSLKGASNSQETNAPKLATTIQTEEVASSFVKTTADRRPACAP